MASIQKTYREIAAFDRDARQYLAREEHKWRAANPEAKTQPPASKFSYAINKMLKRSQVALEQYQEKLQDIMIKHASEDADGNLATDERGQFKFKKDALISRNKEQRELFESKTAIEPYHATADVPDELSADDRETFAGFVIKDEEPA